MRPWASPTSSATASGHRTLCSGRCRRWGRAAPARGSSQDLAAHRHGAAAGHPGPAHAPGLLAGLPVVDVTTTGRRSGLLRTAHLIAVPHRDSLALLGTNFGQPSTPTWVLNLEADPRAHLEYRGRNADAVARRCPGPSSRRCSAGRVALRRLPEYQHRITGRRLRIFVLDSVAG